MKAFRIRVPASTANLGPGFDCLGVAVQLYLRMEVTEAPRFEMVLHGEGADSLPTDASNLIARALATGLAIANGKPERGATPTVLPAVRLSVHNDVPLARGLGSSSAAIVAGLAAGMHLGGAPPDRERLCAAATKLEGHPDNVVPAIRGDLVVTGIEEGEVVSIPLHWPDALRFVTVIPELAIKTKDARRALPDRVSFEDARTNGARLACLLAALQTQRFEHLRHALDDRLHQPYRLPLAHGLSEALAALAAHHDSLGAYLSGSGPTLIALTTKDVPSLGQTGVTAFQAAGVSARALTLAVDRTGVALED